MIPIPNSILAGVDAEIDSILFSLEQLQRGCKYDHSPSCKLLRDISTIKLGGLGLVAAIYDRIEKNLMRRPKRLPSQKNWELRPFNEQDVITKNIIEKNNKSDEVTLERAIVKKWSEDWWYQMPIASGLFGASEDKRRAVDLVHSNGNGHFDFIELKIKSDTPLYAAMEILGYGLVYIASRMDRMKNLAYVSDQLPVLKANKITLCVLAPANYYSDECSLKWLEMLINDGLDKLDKGNLTMDFRFEQFPKNFLWNSQMTSSNLPEHLERISVY